VTPATLVTDHKDELLHRWTLHGLNGTALGDR
jgi:hypothetical protein